MAVELTREDRTPAQVRLAAGKTKDARAARRMAAIALVLEGVDRTSAAETCGMDRQTLRDWVHRYDAEGLAGLTNRPSPGRRSRLTPQQKAELAARVEAGPDPERDGVARWRRIDLKRRIQAGFGVEMHERSVGKQLRAPAPPGVAAEAPEGRLRRPGGVQEDFPETVAAAIPEHARGKPIGIWFQEFAMEAAIGPRPMADARVGQQGTHPPVGAPRQPAARRPRHP
jgi:transposase